MDTQLVQRGNRLFEKMTAFVKHRERMMEQYGALKTTERMAAVSRMKNELNIFQFNPPRSKATYVLRCSGQLQLIAAGLESKYFDSDQEKINEMMAEAEAIIGPTDIEDAQALRANSERTRPNQKAETRPGSSYYPQRYSV